jgi:hypothetical protein
MFWNDPKPDCRWIRDRLPLLVGDDLVGLERRKVERHLIACLPCRKERATLTNALGALHAAAAESPVQATRSSASTSLWPALERQIRESKHEGSRPAFERPNFLEWLEIHLRVRPALAGLTLTLAGLTLLGVGVWSHSRTTTANADVLAATQPILPALDSLPEPAPIEAAPVMSSVVQTESSSGSSSSSPSTSRVDYDLDHGTPMGPDSRGIKSSY